MTTISLKVNELFSGIFPKSMTKKRRKQLGEVGNPYTKKPDNDNITKAVFDALNNVAKKRLQSLPKATTKTTKSKLTGLQRLQTYYKLCSTKSAEHIERKQRLLQRLQKKCIHLKKAV